MAVAITRQGLSVHDLRREAGRVRDAKGTRWTLAIACVLEGQSREDAAVSCGMDGQTLRDWVHRFNANGLAGLADLPRCCGPKPRLSPEQGAIVAEWVEQGPDLERDGVVRWRCVDLQDRIEREFAVSLHERTVEATAQAPLPPPLRAPAAPAQRPCCTGFFQAGFAGLVSAAVPAAAQGKTIEVWFMSLPSGLTRGTRPVSASRAR